MQPFIETVSITGGISVAIVVAVMALTLFYRGLSWITGGEKPEMIAVRGVLKKDTLATVHVSGHEPFNKVRLIGFTNSQGASGKLPWELNGMVILEDETNTRFLIRAKDIRMIIIPPDGKPGLNGEPK